MDTATLSDMYEKMLRLASEGDERGALEFLKSHFKKLPEDVQGKVLVAMAGKAIEDEAVVLDSEIKMKQRGVVALEILEAMRKSLELEKGE